MRQGKQLADALQAAGVKPAKLESCRIHKLPKPCERCNDLHTRAERQLLKQRCAEAKGLHAAWLRQGRGRA